MSFDVHHPRKTEGSMQLPWATEHMCPTSQKFTTLPQPQFSDVTDPSLHRGRGAGVGSSGHLAGPEVAPSSQCPALEAVFR